MINELKRYICVLIPYPSQHFTFSLSHCGWYFGFMYRLEMYGTNLCASAHHDATMLDLIYEFIDVVKTNESPAH